MRINVFDFSAFPQLATDRLLLRQPQLSDADEVLVFRGDSYVQRWNAVPLEGAEQAQTLIEELLTGFQEQRSIYWGITIRGDDRVIGLVGLYGWNQRHHRAETGYDLAREHWGKGIAAEALTAALRFGFEHMELNRVEAETMMYNTESVRLLERVGFPREGVRRQVFWEESDSAYHDSGVFGLLSEEFDHRDAPYRVSRSAPNTLR